MKQIVPLGKNQYVHVDSYSSQHKTRLVNFMMFAVVLIIAGITAGAMVGVDITNFKQGQTNGHTKY